MQRPAYLMMSVLLFHSTTSFAASPTRSEIHVATTGSDGNTGAADAPFATIARAQTEARARIAAGLNGDLAVIVHAGVYELAEPLVFTSEDSGTPEHAVTYAAAPGGEVVLSGGRRLTGWQRGEGEIWTAQAPGVRGGHWSFRHLFVNGRRAIRARTPNADDEPPCLQLKGAKLARDLSRHTYQFAPGQLAQWRNLSDVECVVFGNWATTRKRFQSVDLATGAAEMEGPHARPHNAMNPRAGRWFFIENARKALDEPGEWYLDRKTGTVSYWPLPGEDMHSAAVVAPRLTRLIEIRGAAASPVRNLHFVGLRCEYAEWFPPPGGYLGIQACHFTTGKAWSGNPWGRIDAAIRWDFAEGCSFTDGAIAHIGGCGIELVSGCRHDRIEGNEVFDISGNGIMLGGPKTEDLVPRDDRIANNHVHDCGLDYHGAVGIWVGFAQRAAVAHNLVHDLPYSGISLGWQWNEQPTPARENTIEWNHIYDVMGRLGDGGGIYTLGFQPGTVIRGNHIHDVRRSHLAQAAPNNGMFIDQGSKGYLFERNVIYRTAAQPVRFNQCARDWHQWRDNHFGVPLAGEGKVGKCLACDGSTVYVEVPHSDELEPEQLTVETWFRVAAAPAGKDARRWLVNKNGNEWQQGHYALVIDRARVGAYINIGGGRQNAFEAWSPPGALALGRWQHLALTYDGNTLRVYLDGAEVASSKIGKRRSPGPAPLHIGRRQDGYSYFRGDIDEVQVWSRALAAEELRRHCSDSAAATQSAPGLVGHWGFEDLGESQHELQGIADKAGLEEPYRSRLTSRPAS